MSFFKIDAVEIPFPVIKHSEKIEISLKDDDFGGTFQNPKFLQNPMCIVDVEESLSYQFKIELTDPEVNCMVCLLGIDRDLEDPRKVDYSYYLKQANPGMYHQGVSELNCLLEPGRYLLVCALQSTRAQQNKLMIIINAYANRLSDHPCASEKSDRTTPSPFFAKKIDKSKLEPIIKSREVYTGNWTAMRSRTVNNYVTPAFSEFHSNPGVILNVNTSAKFLIHLRSLGYQRSYQKAVNSEFRYDTKEAPGVSVCIMKINSKNDIKPIFQLEESVPSAWGYWSK